MHDDELIARVRERFGVPPVLLDKARQRCTQTGLPLGVVLVEMGILTSEQGADLDTVRPSLHTTFEPSLAPQAPRADEDETLRSEEAIDRLPPLPGRPVPVDDPVKLIDTLNPVEGPVETLNPITRIGDSVAESEAARRLHAVDVAAAHERWLPHVADPTERYTLGNEIARGGMGRIVEAFDRSLGRTVAMKLMIGGAEEQLAMQMRFTEEAQITGQLEHPNIVPVHDLGVDIEGQLYFTMKRVRGRTLRAALRAVRRAEPEAVAQLTLHRLLNHFKQMCLAVAYAHSRGVVHRDIKPSNVMFGDFGEVLIMDWGLAKILPRAGAGKVHSLREGKRRWATRHGEVIGTPGYMPPELALGQLDDVDARSDVYSLGALLYEILTLQAPYAGQDSREILKRQLREPLVPPRQRAPERNIPAPLEAICMRCLERDMDQRYPSALALHDDIDRFLAGDLEATQKSARAGQLIAEAADHAETWRRATAKLRRLASEVMQRQAALAPTAAVEEHRPIWGGQATLEQVGEVRAQAFNRAEQAYRLALTTEPDNTEGREGISDLYTDAMLDAERAQDAPARRRYAERLQAVDPKRHATLVQGPARLIVQADAPGAQITLLTVDAQDGLYLTGDPQDIGASPARISPVPPGRYLVVMRAPGHHPVQVPVQLQRGEEKVLAVRMLPEDAVARGFVHVPGGVYQVGGDDAALRSLLPQAVNIEDLCVARLPVTCRQYLDFVNDLARTDLHAARRRCPRLFAQGASFFVHREGAFSLPPTAPDGGAFDGNWPVFGVSAADAEAYARWRSQRDGRRYRLPTELEWAIAARGGDGRVFVWGDRWASVLCKNAQARDGIPRLEPVGSFAHDRSPFGVVDLAGGVADWTASTLNDDPELRICRGGSWQHLELRARAASRVPVHPLSVATWIGFRLVHAV